MKMNEKNILSYGKESVNINYDKNRTGKAKEKCLFMHAKHIGRFSNKKEEGLASISNLFHAHETSYASVHCAVSWV